jgi:glycine/D-amino acid oxidase-like deaminating enzyme
MLSFFMAGVFRATQVVYGSRMAEQDSIAIVGAGVIGASIAYALAREGRHVTLIDRAPPGEGGASFGNAGHVATELVEPLPSPSLLFGFWRELTSFGGVLDIPARRLARFTPWAMRFAAAAFRRSAGTAKLAPFMRPAVPELMGLLRDAGRDDLIRQHGHYEIWLRGEAEAEARAQAAAMTALEVPTEPARSDIVEAARRNANADRAAGLYFPKCAHVLDPLEVVRAFVTAAQKHGAAFVRGTAREVRPTNGHVDVLCDDATVRARSALVCAGVWSAPLVRRFGLKAPLEAARGYHVQMPRATPLVDAPILYSNEKIVVTPMQGRVRATSFMEFAGAEAPPDPAKPAWLRATVRKLGYTCDDDAATWVGPRPCLPDYLPAIGRVRDAPQVFYAFGHQHIGLTLSGVTANAVADLVAGRTPRHDISAFDLTRFG